MESKCHDLTITSVDGYKEMKANTDALRKIEEHIKAETLVTLGAVYGDDEWAIDVFCEGPLSCVVIVEIETGITYTYLDSSYSNLFERAGSLPNVFECADMDEFEQDEKNSEALTITGINGNDCPQLHICKDKGKLFKIITCFINDGGLCSGADWLKS